jgi:hypothetical protein
MMRIRVPLLLPVACLPLLAPAYAVAETPSQRVELEARIVEVQTEFLAGLGIAINPMDGQYRSTGAQAPADTSHTRVSGSGGGGFNLMAALFPNGTGPFGAGPAAVGIGVLAEGFYASQESVFALDRHPPGSPDNTVFGKRDIESAVDLAATVRIPIATVPRVGAGGNIVLALQPLVGASFTHVTTSLRSDQTFFGGPDLQESDSQMKPGVLAGIGVTSEITKISNVPYLGDIPVITGLFYKYRHVPASSVEVTSPFGFTEQARVKGSGQHNVNLMIILRANIIRDPFDDD